MKIISWDIEISQFIYATFDPREGFFKASNVITDPLLLCASWKVLGEKSINTVCIKTSEKDDYRVVKTLRDALAEADILVGHNIDKFDFKFLNARLLYHKLDPLPPIPSVDTYKEFKKILRLPSYKLDYLTNFFGLTNKHQWNPDAWIGCTFRDESTLQQLKKYNQRDVKCVEELYLLIRPFMKRHPHVGVLQDKDRLTSCPKCGSTKIKKNGVRPTANGIKQQECQCKSCGGYFRVPTKQIQIS